MTPPPSASRIVGAPPDEAAPQDAGTRRNHQRRQQVATGLLVLVVLVSFGWAVAAQWRHRPAIDWHFSPGWLSLSIALLALFQLGQAELWRFLLSSMSAHLTARRARAIWNLTLIARYVPTSALQVAGRVLLAQRAGVARTTTVASLIYELVLSFAVSLALGVAFLVRLPALADRPLRYVLVLLPLVLLCGLLPAIFSPVTASLLRRLRLAPVQVVLPSRAVLLAGGGYLLCFLVAGLGLASLTRALYHVSWHVLPLLVGAFAVGYIASLLGFLLPGGLGAREAALAAALSPAMPAVVALAVAVSLRLVQIALELAITAGTTWLDRRERLRPVAAMAHHSPP